MTTIYVGCICIFGIINQLLTGGTPILYRPAQLTQIIQYPIDQPSHVGVQSQRYELKICQDSTDAHFGDKLNILT